jgi:hypothetical protein
MKRHHLAKRPQAGYVLPLTIAILSVIMVGAALVAQRSAVTVRLAQQESKLADQQERMDALQSKLLFWLGAVPRSDLGLGHGDKFIKLDGTVYKTADGLMLSLQDARGLINIRDATPLQVERFLATFQIAPSSISKMVDTAVDYNDADDLRQLNGAEADDYRLASSAVAGVPTGSADLSKAPTQFPYPPPRNAPIVMHQEVRRMLNWRDQAALWAADGLDEHSVVVRGTMFNAKTATWRALAAKTGIDAKTARELVIARAAGTAIPAALIDANAERGLFGVVTSETTFPSETVIITLFPQGESWGLRLTATHSPASAIAPWRIEYVSRIERSTIENTATVPLLPELSTDFDPKLRERFGLPF